MAAVSQEFADEVFGAWARLSIDIATSRDMPTLEHKTRIAGIRTTAERLLAEAKTLSDLHGGEGARLFYQAMQEGTAAVKTMQRGMETMSATILTQASAHVERSTQLAWEATAAFDQEAEQ